MPVGHISADRADTVDPVLQKKVNQVVELTGRSKDDVIVALHDCDNDTTRAINMLLEGENDQGEWQESGKRRKNKAPPPAMEPPVPSKPDRPDKSRDRDDRHEGPPPRRGRQPPRLARKNREYEENERNRTDSGSCERGGFGEGRRGGRGRGGMTGSGRGRGRGGRRGDTQGRPSRYDREGSSGPSIGTWTNEAAEKDPNDFQVSTWTDDMTEDWGDEWTGSLEETKVFTKSENNFVSNDTSKAFGSVGDTESTLFSAPDPVPETTSFNSFAAFSNAATNGSALGDVTSALHGGSALGSDPLTNSLGLTPSSLNAGTGSLGQTSTLGQRLDIGMLLKSAEAEAAAQQQQQSQFISQFTKPAVDTSSRQHSVGLGGGVSLSDERLGSSLAEVADRVPPVSLHTHQAASQNNNVFSQQNTISQSISQSIAPTQSIGQAITQALTQSISPPSHSAHSQQQRPKVQRSKLPPPSKIPQNAVEMPGHLGQFNLDVQFGNWGDASTHASSGVGFGFGIDAVEASTAYTTSVSSSSPSTVISNHLSVGSHALLDDASSPSSLPTHSSASASVATVSSASAPDARSTTPTPSAPAGFPNPSPAKAPANDSYQTTPHQNSIPSATQGSPQSPPEPIPFPTSQTEQKTSPHYGQRSASSTGPLSSKSSGASIPFNQSPYSSNYQAYSAGKTSAGLNGPAYPSHTASPGQGSQHLSNSSGGSGYVSAAYQSFHQPAGYSSNQTSNAGSLYPGATSQSTAGSYSNQTSSSAPPPGSYQNQSGASSASSYPSQSNAYQNQSQTNYHSRDNVVTNSYTTPVSSYSSSVGYQTLVNGGQPNAFQAAVSQANSSYNTGSSPYQRDPSSGQSNYNPSQTYSAGHQSSLPLSANKLPDSLQKMTVKDNTLDTSSRQGSSQFDSSAVSSASPHSTPSCTASLSSSSASVCSALGLTSNTTTTSATASSMTTGTKSTLPLTSKAPPNLPPGVPPLMSSYMIGQPAGLPFAFAGLPQQQMYSYEDLQLLQRQLPPMPTNMPSTLPAARDQTIASVPYAGSEGKLGRLDAQSPVQTNASQQQQQAASQSAHQQFISPASLPHYNYYYPSIVPGGYSYPPTMFPAAAVGNIVPPVTAHGSTSANTQYQKPAGYAASHGYGAATYDDLSNQTQDFSKTYGVSQSASKVSAASAVTSSGSDLSGASAYGKSHAQSYDKVGFAAGTPPPFNLALSASGSQAAGLPQAAAAAYGTPYMPVMTHQQLNSQMMHAHHMPQESAGGSSRVAGQAGQGKPGVSKGYSTGGYWGN